MKISMIKQTNLRVTNIFYEQNIKQNNITFPVITNYKGLYCIVGCLISKYQNNDFLEFQNYNQFFTNIFKEF